MTFLFYKINYPTGESVARSAVKASTAILSSIIFKIVQSSASKISALLWRIVYRVVEFDVREAFEQYFVDAGWEVGEKTSIFFFHFQIHTWTKYIPFQTLCIAVCIIPSTLSILLKEKKNLGIGYILQWIFENILGIKHNWRTVAWCVMGVPSSATILSAKIRPHNKWKLLWKHGGWRIKGIFENILLMKYNLWRVASCAMEVSSSATILSTKKMIS